VGVTRWWAVTASWRLRMMADGEFTEYETGELCIR
jgi:hypothetical protein